MAIELSNHNLDFLAEEEESVISFLNYLITDTKVIDTYYGEPYLFKPMGDAEFWIQTAIIENGNLEAARFNSHGRGECVWNVLNSGIDITPKDSPRLSKVALFTSTDEEGLVPIELVNADVLPSHLPHDKYTMQVVALPLEINYYAAEEDYVNAQPEDKNGEKWLIADGRLFPANFLYNHNPENYEEGKNYESDARTLFRATVKQLYIGRADFGIEKLTTDFIRCIADTEFGELEFVHSLAQVPEAQQDNIKVGSVISGVCIVSGDVAIYDYKNGIVLNYENDLKLLRHTLVKGEAERMKRVLADDAVYETDTYNKKYIGKNEIIDRFNEINNAREEEYRAHLATIIETDEDNMEFPVGTRCIVLEDEGEYESIVFIKVNEKGNITHIRICKDSRYHFQIEAEETEQIEE